MNIKLQRKQNLRKEVIYKNIDGVFSLDQTGRETKKGVFPLLFSSMVYIPNYFFLPFNAATESAFLVESALRKDSAFMMLTESALRIESACRVAIESALRIESCSAILAFSAALGPQAIKEAIPATTNN